MTVGFQRFMWTSLSSLRPQLSIRYGLFNSDVHKSDYIVGCGMKPNLMYGPGICSEVLGKNVWQLVCVFSQYSDGAFPEVKSSVSA